MNFGKHVPESVTKRTSQPVASVFTRGLQTPGSRWVFRFGNGFGASVINDGYGAEVGKYELGVLGPSGALTYDTPITDDVLGYLTAEEVAETLDRIEALEAGAVEAEIKRRAEVERDARIAELRRELAELEASR